MLALLWLAMTPVAGQADGREVFWHTPVEVVSGDAFRGPWRMNHSEFHYVDDPTVAIGSMGDIGIAWADQSRQDIFFLRSSVDADNDARFDEPVNVSRSPDTFSWLPRMVMQDHNPRHVHLLWQEIIFSGGSHGGEIFYARSTDGGETFSEPVNLSRTTAGAGKGRLTRRDWHNGSLDLLAVSGEVLIAAWTEYEGALRVSHSTDGGASFSEPLRIAGDDDRPARGPSLAVAPDGEIHIAWAVGEDRRADIHIARSSNAGGSFDDLRIVAESRGHADAPTLAVDNEGVVHLVFAESPDGPGRNYRLHYTRSNNGGRDFDRPREIPALPDDSLSGAGFPVLDIDDDGNLYLVWELFPGLRDRPQGLGFTMSRDGGDSFAAPSTVPGSGDPAHGVNGSQQGLLMRKLAVNAAGEIAVVNSTYRQGDASRVWLFRGRTTTTR